MDLKCPVCGGATTKICAAGGHGPNLLPGLGGFLRFATLRLVVCGALQMFADEDAIAKLPGSRRWTRLPSPPSGP